MATEQFHYDLNGTKITLPHMKNLPVRVFRKYRHDSELDQVFGILEELCDDKALEAIDDATLEELLALQKAWNKASEEHGLGK